MKCKLIALDIDGTVVNDQKCVTDRTRDALIAAQARGIRLALISARPTRGLEKTARALRMHEYRGLLFAYNGGRITNAQTGETFVRASIRVSTAKRILHLTRSLPADVILEDGVRFYTDERTLPAVEYESRINGMAWVQVEDLSEALTFEPQKLLLRVPEDRIDAIREKIAGTLPQELSVVQTAAFYLEVIPAAIDKGRALREACELTGIDPAESIAFGDAQNDIPMLRAAGKGIAMGNADACVKDAADFVTLSNEADGVAEALFRFGIL